MARELDRLNRERRDIEATMQDEALAEVGAAARRSATPARSRCACIGRSGIRA